MPKSLYFDFDAHWHEREREPFPVKVMGQVYQVSPEIPAALVLDFLALTEKQQAGEAPPMTKAMLSQFFEATFGEGSLDAMLAKNISMVKLTDLMTFVMSNFAKPDAGIVADGTVSPPVGSAVPPLAVTPAPEDSTSSSSGTS